MTTVLIEILIIILLILLNGTLAMSEIAIVAARKVRLQQAAIEGSPGAKVALDIANQPGRFLSTVQIGITLVGILAGAFGGATIAEELETFLNSTGIGFLSEYRQVISVGVVVIVITFMSLIFGELAPKQIGLNNSERIATAVAPVMRLISRLTSPIVNLLTFTTNMVLRVVGVQHSADLGYTEEEIKLLIEQGAEGGIFEPEEGEIVEQVFRLADRSIVAQMTPRTEIVWLEIDDPIQVIQEKLANIRYSYYPVARGGIDQILGVVQVNDLLSQCLSQKSINLQEIIFQPLFLPESTTILETLKRFREHRLEIAVIIDEFGGIQGLTTITDILEAVAGDFPDAFDAADPEIIIREDGTYLLDGRLDIDEFKGLFNIGELPGEKEKHYQTLGGFVMTYLGRIPSAGEFFEWEQLRLEIVDMDGLRVDKIWVSPKEPY
ncbi:MAG: HlyC/CorC family transporter [Anaerolineales bacterium]|nr:MAG: HlyC/CorC family transporter [Anaerolineales bacterium]